MSLPRPDWRWGVAAVLAAQAFAMATFGTWSAWVRESDGDLQTRAVEFALFRAGVYPNAHLEPHGPPWVPSYTVYPPYAFPLFAVFFEPGGMVQGRLLVEMLSLAGVVVMGLFAYRALVPYGLPVAMIGAVSGAAFAGNVTALIVGQFSIISAGLVVQQIIFLERGRPLLAGVCWALAMIKPQIGLPFVVLFLRRGAAPGALLGSAILIGAAGFACAWTGVSPTTVIGHWQTGMSLAFIGEGSGIGPGAVARAFGVSHRVAQYATLALLAGLAVPLARLIRKRPEQSILPLAGACGVLGMFATYHRPYDNIMLFPTVVATLLAAAASRQAAAVAIAAAMLLSVVIHRRLVPEAGGVVAVQGVVWAAAAALCGWQVVAGRGSSSAGDAVAALGRLPHGR